MTIGACGVMSAFQMPTDRPGRKTVIRHAGAIGAAVKPAGGPAGVPDVNPDGRGPAADLDDRQSWDPVDVPVVPRLQGLHAQSVAAAEAALEEPEEPEEPEEGEEGDD